MANSKGGTGKTTLAVHVADWFHFYGWPTVLVDCDTQRLSSRWLNEALSDVATVVPSGVHEIDAELPKLHEQFQVVIVDAPGGLGEVTGAILSYVDAVLVPTGPGNLDIMGSDWTTQEIHQVQEMRDGQPQAVVVPVRANENRKTTRHLRSVAHRLRFGVTAHTLPSREIYMTAAGIDNQPMRLLWELGRSKHVRRAALEMDALIQEIFPEVAEKDPGRVASLVTPIQSYSLKQPKGTDGEERAIVNG